MTEIVRLLRCFRQTICRLNAADEPFHYLDGPPRLLFPLAEDFVPLLPRIMLSVSMRVASKRRRLNGLVGSGETAKFCAS